MTAKKAQTSPQGTTNAKIQIPEALHETMKTIRQIRHQLEGADVKLCRIYREAVEQYVNAKPQQQLLKGWKDAASRTVRPGERPAVRM